MLFGFALLFPGAAFQNAFAHPISFDRDFWGTLDFDSSKCTEVTVSADVTNLKIIWTSVKESTDFLTLEKTWESNKDDFDDGIGGYSGAEIEVLYKIWEPKHTKEGYGREEYDSAHKIPHMRNPGKVVSAIQIEDVEFNGEVFAELTDGSGKKGTWPTADIKIQTEWGYSDGFWDRDHIHQKYFHQTCVEDLDKLVLAVAVSEIDGGGYLEHKKIDALFGGKKMEDVIEKNTQEDSLSKLTTLILEGREAVEKKFGDVSYSLPGENIEFRTNSWGRIGVEVTEKVIMEVIVEDRLLPMMRDGLAAHIAEKARKEAQDLLLNPSVIERSVEDALRNSKRLAAMDIIANEHLAKELIEKIVSKGGQELTEEAAEIGFKKIAKSGLKKVAGYLLGGPVGWVWFAYDTVGDLSDVWDYFNGPNQFLGSGVWRIDLSADQVGKGPFSITTVTNNAQVVEYAIPPSYPEGTIFYVTSLPSKEIKKILNTQFGTAEITFEIEIKRPFCVSPSSSRTPEGAEQSLGQSISLNNADGNLGNSDSLNNYINKQFELLRNIIQKYNLGEPIEEPQPEPEISNIGNQTNLVDSTEIELVIDPETGLLINPVTGMIEFFPEEKLVEKPGTESGSIPLPEVDPPLRFLKTVDGNSELREDENGNKEAVFNFLILDDKGQPPKSPEITIFQNQEAVALSENDFSIDDEGWFQYVQNSPGEWIISIADIKSQEENQVFDGSICYEFTEIVPPRDCFTPQNTVPDSAPFGTPWAKGAVYTASSIPNSDTIYDLYEPDKTPIFVVEKSWATERHQNNDNLEPNENVGRSDVWGSWRFVYSDGQPASGIGIKANLYKDLRYLYYEEEIVTTDANGMAKILLGDVPEGEYRFVVSRVDENWPYTTIVHDGTTQQCYASFMDVQTHNQKVKVISKSVSIPNLLPDLYPTKYEFSFQYEIEYNDGEPIKNTNFFANTYCPANKSNYMISSQAGFNDKIQDLGLASGTIHLNVNELAGCELSLSVPLFGDCNVNSGAACWEDRQAAEDFRNQTIISFN